MSISSSFFNAKTDVAPTLVNFSSLRGFKQQLLLLEQQKFWSGKKKETKYFGPIIIIGFGKKLSAH